MTESRRRILEMLAEKKISVDEAHRLLSLVDSEEGGEAGQTGSDRRSPKYLRVVVQPNADSAGEAKGERVNIRVPMALIRAGVRLTSLIPEGAADHVNEALQGKGIDLDLRKIKSEDIEHLLEALGELEVDVDGGRERVRVYVE